MWWIALAFAGSEGVDRLDWLGGCWTAQTADMHQQECWNPAHGGVMLGTHLDSGKHTFFEFLRIETHEGALTYFAQPRGGPPVAFTLKVLEGDRVEFVNPAHDFPKSIEYRRSGDTLTATASAGEDRRSWVWTRTPTP